MVAKLPSMVVSAVTTFDGKALAKGSKDITTFAKKAAGALGLAFGTTAVVNFGKASVKAFAENEKSAIRLANVVKNLGQAFELPGIERNLDEISAKFGYEGEVLRAAFQKLITTTGSATKAQELLNLSLDVAAGSGQDLLTVNQDLAAIYTGNTKGLKKYNLGLTQAELKTLNFEDAVKLLGKTFKGAAGQELTTFSGKMRVLGEAAGNAQEIIGGGLVEAFGLLAGESDGIEPLVTSMTTLATSISDATVGLGSLLGKLKELPGGSFVSGLGFEGIIQAIPILGSYINILVEEGKKVKALKGPTQGYLGSMPVGIYPSAADEAKRRKVEADRLKNEKRLAAERAKTARAEKQKISLTKAAAVFDSTRISLAAALQATYDKETKLRLEALMLIEEDKGDAALKKISELSAFQKNADMQRLAGVETISNATLGSLNTQLLTELRVINDSKMAEGDKELAREEAFKKYNAAITAAGTLMAKESYNERVQIQLTEIARLAAISKTYNAAATANLLLESAELSMIDRIAIAQKAADDQRLAALKEYQNLLGGAGGGGGGGGTPDLTSYIEKGPLGGLAAGVIAGVLPTLSTMPTLDEPAIPNGWNPTMGFPGQSIELTVNTGIGDPEAIARAVEDLLNQSSYRGTSVNRGSGNYIL
jgi:hypothetical protein